MLCACRSCPDVLRRFVMPNLGLLLHGYILPSIGNYTSGGSCSLRAARRFSRGVRVRVESLVGWPLGWCCAARVSASGRGVRVSSEEAERWFNHGRIEVAATLHLKFSTLWMQGFRRALQSRPRSTVSAVMRALSSSSPSSSARPPGRH